MCYGMGTQGNGAYFSLLRQRKGGQKKGCFFKYRFRLVGRLAPAAGLTFLCFAKEKISKRKASQRPCPCGVPCATRAARGWAQTRYAQTSARPDPCAAALLSTAYGSGRPRVLVRCAHIAHACWRGASYCGCRRSCSCPCSCTGARSRAAPSPQPFTTTATFTNLGQPTRPATSRTNTGIRPKKTNWLLRLPFTPAGGKGRGGSGGQNSGGQDSRRAR